MIKYSGKRLFELCKIEFEIGNPLKKPSKF